MIKVLIAPNSFKECAYSTDAANLIADSLKKGFQNLNKKNHITEFPISDGGDGFLQVVKKHFKTDTIYYKISSITGSSTIKIPVEYSKNKETLFIESAQIIGLKLVPKKLRNPMKLSSAPLGELLLKINSDIAKSKINAKKVVIGIGGTATNDLGMGLLSKFEFQLSDKNCKRLDAIPKNFLKANVFFYHPVKLNFKIQIVTDVENPVLGSTGATNIFARQKGAGEKDITVMEEGFEHILNLWGVNGEKVMQLSGAGGGVAAALQYFFGAKTINAKKFILHHLGLAKKNHNFNIVITGEGSLDNQTLLNKGAMIIYDCFKSKNAGIYCICGEDNLIKKPDTLKTIELRSFFGSREESIKKFSKGISFACQAIINDISKHNFKG